MHNHRKVHHWHLLPILLAGMLLLAACGGQPQTQAPPVAAGLRVSSATESAVRSYVLSGTVQLPDEAIATLEYNLNGAGWLPVDLSAAPRFSVTLMLNEGTNTIQLALSTAEGERVEEELTVNVSVSATPRIVFRSAGRTTSSTYRLIGLAVDDTGIASATYQLNDAEPEPLELTTTGDFDVAMELAAGPNSISVTVVDEGGNSVSDTLTVTYEPQISGVSATPMIARAGEPVTIVGRNFGTETGSVLFGGEDATVLDWADSEITVTVPRRGVGGWADVEIVASGSTFLVENFFVGIEVTDSDLSAAILAAEPEAGTAFLLSGSDYVLTQVAVDDPANYLPAYSFFGAPTGGEPTTILRPSDGMLLLYSNAGLRIQLQDLEIRAHAVHSVNDPSMGVMNVQPAASETAVGQFLQNVRIFHQAATSLDPADAVVAIGASSLSVDAGGSPPLLSLDRVEIAGFGATLLAGVITSIVNSDIEPGDIALILASQGWLDIDDSEFTSTGSSIVLLVGRLGVSAEGNVIELESGLVGVNWLLAPTGSGEARLELRDNTIAIADLAGFGINAVGFSESVIAGNSIIGSVNVILTGTGSQVTDNVIESTGVSFQLQGAEALFQDNTVTYRDGLQLAVVDDSEMTFQGNDVTGPVAVNLVGYGSIDVLANGFDFTGIARDLAAVAVTSNAAGPLEITFDDNQTVGSNRLFSFNAAAAELQVSMTGNVFDAELTLPGDVATLLNVTAPSLIETSANTWGQLSSADDVRALIALSGSTADRMTVAEF